MKAKFIIAALFAASVITTASAQDFTENLRYGAKVGMNFSNVTNSGSTAYKIGLTVGVTADYAIDDKSAISADLLFSQQGAKASDSGDVASVSVSTAFNYINIPILYNYYIVDGIAVKAGIQPGFLASAKGTYNIAVGGMNQNGSESIKDACNSFDFAIPVGVSYDVTENLIVDARYNFGLTDTMKENEGDSMRNNVFNISVGYKF